MRKHVFFFDVLRCVAAFAVITIHVLGPFRQQFGMIPFSEWSVAITFNGFTRWAVPVFILITGALMLSDNRPFDLKYYLQRRLGKVLVPFIVWSLFYAYLSGWSANGFSSDESIQVLQNSLHHSTYYHLGFFYYFIPLYFVIPFFQWMVRNFDDKALYTYLVIWLITSTLFLFRIDGPWSHQMWLYSGYLLLGYVLYQKVPLNRKVLLLLVVLGFIGMFSSVLMVILNSIDAGEYKVGRWLSYKTINTVAAASMVFMLVRYYGENLSSGLQNIVGFISKHSLGIYILHPIFLWPVIELKWYEGLHPLWFIPVTAIVCGSAALATSWLLSRTGKTRWLLP